MTFPSAEPEPERYDERPLLLVLENYILDCIGELEDEKQGGMITLIQKIFGGEDDWKATVRQVLEFDDELDGALREMWEKNQQLARNESFSLHPVQFAKMCADENFSHYFAASPEDEGPADS